MKKRSLPLVLALVASTSMIVNCQKAPSKRAATTTNGNNSATGALDPAAAALKTAADLKITEECSVEIKNARKELHANNTKFNEQFMNKNISDLSENEKAQFSVDVKKIVEQCEAYLAKLKTVNGAGCKDSENKNAPLVIKDKAQQSCEKNGHVLKQLTGQDNELAKQFQDSQSRKGQEKAIEKLKAETLLLSKEGQALMSAAGVLWKSFLDMGEVKTSKTELEKLVKDGKTVCSFEEEMKITTDKTAEFQLVSIADNQKNPDNTYEHEVLENYETMKSGEKSSVVLTFSRVNAGDNNGDLNYLVCVNVKKDQMTAQKIKQVLGKVLKVDDRTEDQRQADQSKESAKNQATTSTASAQSAATKASQTVTVIPQGASSSPQSGTGQKVTTDDITVESIDVEGTKYQIINLSNGEKVKIESGKISLKAASAGQSGSVVKIESKDGKRYLLDKQRQKSALIIEEKERKESKKVKPEAAKPVQAAESAASSASASSDTIVDEKSGLKISTTLGDVKSDQNQDTKSNNAKIALNEKEVQALREKFVGLKGQSELVKIASISYDQSTRTQSISLFNEVVLLVESSKIIDMNLINSVVRIEFDPYQKPVKDLKTGKLKLTGILVLSNQEAIKVTWLKDAKK
ncbi:MAG: hypothetical protein ACK4VO_11835 [Pseudobdellovibrio sp.]